VKDSHATGDAGKCVPDAGGDKGCSDVIVCTDATLNTCSVPTGTCYDPKAAANKECTAKKDGMSVTLGGQCVADCNNTDTTKTPKTTSVPGFH
jgi:hypothetical protein